MECNKDEAMRAKEIAEKKMQMNDFEGARKIALKGKNLYPELENITQMLSICDVHCSAQNRILGSEKDWYGVLQVEKLADEAIIKKQYRRLALILHPDKNRFPGAEGAFKLICEANALLSDPAKKSLYDNKIRVWSRHGTTNPPNHHTNRSSQPNNQYGAQSKNTSNGFNSLNHYQNTQSTSVFWTCCPFCKVNYQYHRQYIKKLLQCTNSKCSKGFVAYEVSAPYVSPAEVGRQGSQHVPSKPDILKPDGYQANCEIGRQNVKAPSMSHAGSQGAANMKNVQPQPGVRKGGRSESVKVSSTAEDLNGKKVGVTSNGGPVRRESRNTRTKGQKRGRKFVLESSDGSDTEQENLGDAAATDLKSESTHSKFARRSSRSRQHVSYKEADEDHHSRPLKRAQTTQEADGEDSKHGNQNTVPGSSKFKNKETGAAHSKESLKDKDEGFDKEAEIRGATGGRSSAPADPVQIESDSDLDLSPRKDSETHFLECPDPEFSDFEKLRDESQFRADQFWALYDTLDSMPRFYAKVRKVGSPFELHITWLEAVPIHDSFKRWVKNELPAGCGSFKIGKTDKISARASLSHQVHCEKGGKRGSFFIYPREGEVWALFKDWDISWSSNPENHMEFRYEIVEVLSNFAEGIGIKVVHLDKVAGFVSLFQRGEQNETSSFLIGPTELYKFSHCVPSFKMTGAERKGVPIGSFELDPASIPLSPDDLYVDGKAKMECRDNGPGVESSLPNEKGKSAVSGSFCSPHKSVDLEGRRCDDLRRSPRGVNIMRQSM
ncbi:uncharacterized protein LOC130986874 [Salvia miltiorrhiza]|uniref:uncharacterized protein LOC130986874 n=1 Tax=Salvia miltiorrhiza TaxID=226208 RepID=UPI0025AD12C6|nr:uncharacterized protein LOC130986874 [Salvia miltiorrhiza]XP_057766399.1 uncharacterized protein LOC130986874 [Salvia miltiorrhiza]XP_057766402.1 uncharacterized protein LOC130986874 [Salvia miltiorrhiza]